MALYTPSFMRPLAASHVVPAGLVRPAGQASPGVPVYIANANSAEPRSLWWIAGRGPDGRNQVVATTGHEMVRRLQQALGIRADAVFGADTARALAAKLRATDDPNAVEEAAVFQGLADAPPPVGTMLRPQLLPMMIWGAFYQVHSAHPIPVAEVLVGREVHMPNLAGDVGVPWRVAPPTPRVPEPVQTWSVMAPIPPLPGGERTRLQPDGQVVSATPAPLSSASRASTERAVVLAAFAAVAAVVIWKATAPRRTA